MLAYIIKSSLLLILFYAFFILFMRKTTFFRFNRMALMLGTATCMLLPLANFRMGMIPGAEVLPRLVIPEITVTGGTMEETGTSFNWTLLLTGLYLAGAAVVFILTLVSLMKTLVVIHQNKSIGTQEERISIVDSDFPSFSFLRNIVISREDYVNNPVILQHEIAHVKCRHSVDLLFFSAVTILHWFNPLVWIIRSELKMLHEYEADEAVINKGIDVTQYQLLLVKKAVGTQRFQLANGFNHTKLKNRITMMQMSRTNKWAGLGYILCLPMLFGALCFCTNQPDEKEDDSLHTSEIETKANEVQAVPFQDLEETPLFNGQDANEFSKWVSERLVYPESAKSAGIQGRVLVSFTISAEGKVTNVNLIKGIDEALDAEAIRVVSQSPDWTPGKQNGHPVPVLYTFPIIFMIK